MNKKEITLSLADDCGSPYPDVHADRILEAMEEYAKYQSIAFNNWLKNSGYAEHSQWHQRMNEDNPMNDTELYNLFLQSTNSK